MVGLDSRGPTRAHGAASSWHGPRHGRHRHSLTTTVIHASNHRSDLSKQNAVRIEWMTICLIGNSTYLDYGGAGNDIVVSDLRVAFSEDNVALPGDALRYGHGEPAAAHE